MRRGPSSTNRLGTTEGSQNLGSKGMYDFVTVLAYYPAIFGHADHRSMVAEAPNQHGGGLGHVGGGLGHVEGGKNCLNGRHVTQ